MNLDRQMDMASWQLKVNRQVLDGNINLRVVGIQIVFKTLKTDSRLVTLDAGITSI